VKVSINNLSITRKKQPGQTVQLDRYRFFGNPGTKTSRERTQDQTIGTANSRSIVKDKQSAGVSA